MSSPAAHTRKDMTVVTQVSVQVPGAGGQLGGSVITRVRGDEGLGEVEVVRMGRRDGCKSASKDKPEEHGGRE